MFISSLNNTTMKPLNQNKMDKRQIEKYREKKGMKPQARLEKNDGGQYLDNFLVEFAQDIKEKTINDAVTTLKRMRF